MTAPSHSCMICGTYPREHFMVDENGWYLAVCSNCTDPFTYVMPWEIMLRMRRALTPTVDNIASTMVPWTKTAGEREHRLGK